MPVTLKIEEAAAQEPIRTENTLDPGEVVLSNAAVDVMAQIISLSKDSVDLPKAEVDSGMASIVIGAILVYLLIKIAFRIMPWILGIGAVFLLVKMYGTA